VTDLRDQIPTDNCVIRIVNGNHLGPALRDIRRGAGLTQADLSALAGIKQPSVSAHERSCTTPDVRTLLRVVNALGYDLALVKKR